ncbi:MAG: terminase family protein [Pseudomonadota bacterium]
MQIRPTVPQDRFIRSTAKYPAFVGGLGSGKTEALVNRAIMRKIESPKTDRAFYEPTYDLIRRIAWPRFEEKLSQLKIPYKLLKSPHNEIKIKGLGKIIFRSMENPDNIIGYQVHDSDVDELDTLPHEKAAKAWRNIIARNRTKKPDGAMNTIGVATTPEGFRFMYERWELKGDHRYQLIRGSTRSNAHNLPDDYIDELLDAYPEHLHDAYLEGLFANLTSGTVYRCFDRRRNVTDELPRDKEPLHIGMDFNVGEMSAVIHVEREGKPRAVGEVVGGLDTPDMIGIIRRRYGSERTITIYPDSTGDNRKSVDASKTDISQLRQAGFRISAPKKNPPVRDRINCMNKGFESGDYLVNVKACPTYTRCLEQQAYNKNGEPDKTQGLDHHPDAGGYFMHRKHPIIKPATSTTIGMAH